MSVAALPPPVRDVVLALLQGRTTAEIAALQRVENVTVRTRLRRAREVLWRELGPYIDRSYASEARAVGGSLSSSHHEPGQNRGRAGRK